MRRLGCDIRSCGPLESPRDAKQRSRVGIACLPNLGSLTFPQMLRLADAEVGTLEQARSNRLARTGTLEQARLGWFLADRDARPPELPRLANGPFDRRSG